MPRGDRTGPTGMGPMTGRAAGFCAGNTVPGFGNAGFGQGGGFGRGRGGFGGGFGRGFRNRNFAPGFAGWGDMDAVPMSIVDEKTMLGNQAQALQTQLDEIQKRLGELDAE